MGWNNNIRKTLALFQAALLCLIFVSGSLFMHKHTTVSGKIVIHVHPYDLSKAGSEPQHHSTESEIHFLDVVYHGQFLGTSFVTVQATVVTHWPVALRIDRDNPDRDADHTRAPPRGPPCIFS